MIRLLDFDGALVDGAPPPVRILGTANYWSPEHQAPDTFGRPSKASDVFTLGIMLYQILGRKVSLRIGAGFMTRAWEHPSKLAPWLSPSASDAIWRALSPRPSERPGAKDIHATLLEKPSKEPVKSVSKEPPNAPLRVALLAPGRRIRFWQDAVLSRENLRGISGYEYVSRYQAPHI